MFPSNISESKKCLDRKVWVWRVGHRIFLKGKRPNWRGMVAMAFMKYHPLKLMHWPSVSTLYKFTSKNLNYPFNTHSLGSSYRAPMKPLISCAEQIHSSQSEVRHSTVEVIELLISWLPLQNIIHPITCPMRSLSAKQPLSLCFANFFERQILFAVTFLQTLMPSQRCQTNMLDLLRSLQYLVSLVGCTFQPIITGTPWVLGYAFRAAILHPL